MENKQMIKNIIDLCTKLQNLCEGFDVKNKTILISSKLKALLYINEKEKISPSELIDKLGLAKSNIALLCNSMCKEELIKKEKDTLDTRIIFYSLTLKGKEYLKKSIDIMTENFVRQLSY